MGIDVNQGNGLVTLKRAHDGDGDAVIAAQCDQGGAARENFSGSRFCTPVMLLMIIEVRCDIAAVHDLDVSAIKQRAAKIPVVTGQGVGHITWPLPNRIRCEALVVSHAVRVVRQSIRDAEDCDIRIQLIEIQLQRKVEQCF